MGTAPVQSAVYEGQLRHRRFLPVAHAFSYSVFMVYLDLDELPALLDKLWGWSARGRALAEFRRSDYLGDPRRPLKQAVQDVVEQALQYRPGGPVRVLTNLRYFGHCFNPVTFYYCFAADGETLQAIVPQVNNTPWNERHHYVIDCREQGKKQATAFDKQFHVSPFNPLGMQYRWRSCRPGPRLVVHMENHRDAQCHMDATLVLKRRPWRASTVQSLLWRYPLMSLQVVKGIYWQAFKLYRKGAPVYAHPLRSSKGRVKESMH